MKSLRPHQTLAHDQLRAGYKRGKKRGLLVMPTGAGKCLAPGTAVLMYDGTVKPVESVAVGDLLMGPDSLPRRVLSLASGREMMYRVTPVKGDPYTVNESHILSVRLTPDRSGLSSKLVNLSVREYLAESATFRHRAKGWRAGVQFPAVPVEIDPYFLGLWLGDGTARTTHVSKPDEEVKRTVVAVARRWGMIAKPVEVGPNRCPTHSITRGRFGGGDKAGYVNPLRAAFARLGLMPAKFVPHVYKANSRAVRLGVLAGILDADGSLGHCGYDFISQSRQLADDVCFLARSLGLAAYLAPCRKSCQGGHTGDYYRVSISGDCDMIPMRIERKKCPPRQQKKDVLVTGIRVEPVGVGDYFGFEIDGDRLFMLGDFTVTHNTVTALEILRLTAEQGRRGLFLCDRRVLVAQAAREAREYGIDCGVLMRDAGPLYRNPEAPIQFASKDTMLSWMVNRRDFDLPPSDLIVTDEAHRSAAQTWEALLAAFPQAWEVGLTATPARSDSKGLGNRYEFLCQPTSYSALIAAGVLVPARCFAPGSKVESNKNKAKRPKRADLVGDVVGWWEKLAKGKRTFVFASGVQHSLALRDEFLRRGYAADHLDGDTPDDERDAVLSKTGRLASGKTLVVCSCSVLKYGVDCPSVECVQLVDGFGSLVDYLQACGRGLRASPGKDSCVVIDHAGAVLFHGFPDADRQWALAETLDHSADWQMKVNKGDIPKPQACPHCSCVFAARPDCPACGWRPKREPKPSETNKGQLFEVERAAAVAFTPDDFRKGWAQCVAQAHHTGKSLSVAAAVFKKRFNVLPWAVRVQPLPPSGYNWHRPASDFWREAFVSSKATS